MPYEVKGKCIYKKDGGAKVGCTKGSVKKYLAALHANADEAIEPQETITEMKGGKAEGMSIKDIANKHDVPVSKIEKQIQMGKKIEHEHTDSDKLAKEIAMDHLVEFPDYYTRLEKLEKAASKHLKDIGMNENTKTLIKRLIRENLVF
jgi:hypothetical protein